MPLTEGEHHMSLNMEKTETNECAIYVRKSTIDQRQSGGRSISGQIKDCQKLAESHGMKVVKVFEEEEGTSSSRYSKKKRPEWDAALNEIGTKYKNLIVWALDRGSRKGFEEVGQILTTIEECGGRMISFQDQIDTLGMDFMQRMNLVLRAEFAKNESDLLSARITRGKEVARERGLWGTGAVPYPYKMVREAGQPERVEQVPEQVEVIHRVKEMIFEGVTMRTICKTLNEEGVRNRKGAYWSAQTLSYMMKNVALIGQRHELGDVAREENGDPKIFHEAVLTESEFLKIQESLSSRRRTQQTPKTKSSRRATVLSGLLECERCGSPLSGTCSKNVKYRYYSCRIGCQGSMRYESLNDYVGNIALAHLSKIAYEDPSSEILQEIGRRWLGVLDPELKKEEIRKLDELTIYKDRLTRLHADYYEHGRIEEKQFFKMQDGLFAKIKNLEGQLQKEDTTVDHGPLLDLVSCSEAEGEDVFDFTAEGSPWSQLKDEEKRMIAYLLIDKIVIADHGKGEKPTIDTPLEERVKEITFNS
jgi:site-specific DNA recombinase